MRHTFDILRPQRIRDALVGLRRRACGGVHRPRGARRRRPACSYTPPAYLDLIRQPADLGALALPRPRASLGRPPAHAVPVRVRRHARRGPGGGRGRRHRAQSRRRLPPCAGATKPKASAPSPTSPWPSADCSADGRVARVLIVDLDYHHGNGNAEIFAQRRVGVHLLDARQQLVLVDQAQQPGHRAASPHGRRTSISTPCDSRLPPILAAFRPEFVFYVAGSDPFVEDRSATSTSARRGCSSATAS